MRVVREAVVRLARDIPVICCAGNHDVSHNPLDASALECLKDLPNVYVAERPQMFALRLDGQSVQCFCLPYPRKSQLLASDAHKDKPPEEVTAVINHALATILRGFRLEFEAGIPHILLAHGSVAHCQVNDQPRSLAHDILLPLDELSNFDFAALGHIHQRQSLNDANTVWYSGSLIRNGFGEEHEPKGCHVVELCQGRPPHVQFVENPHARKYKTLSMRDVRELEWQGVSAEHVYRIKDTLSPAEHESAKPLIDRWCAEHPWTQVEVELATEARARDAGMATMLTMEDTLLRALAGHVEEPDLPAVLEKHRSLVAHLEE